MRVERERERALESFTRKCAGSGQPGQSAPNAPIVPTVSSARCRAQYAESIYATAGYVRDIAKLNVLWTTNRMFERPDEKASSGLAPTLTYREFGASFE